MSNQKILRPAEGVKVRHPDGRHLASDGETVTMTTYWQRRLADGDVVAVNAASPVQVSAKLAADGRNKTNQE